MADIRFPKTSDHPFLMCRNCKNHLMSFQQNQVEARVVSGLVVCSHPVNVRVDANLEDHQSFIHNQPVVNVYCNGCNDNLGKQFVVTGAPMKEPYVEEGKFVFHMGQTLVWNGKQVVCFDTNKPPVDEDKKKKVIPKRPSSTKTAMVESPFFRRFPKYYPFLMCRNCKTHILSFRQNYDAEVRRDRELDLVVCRDPVNVRVDDNLQNQSLIHDQPVVNVNCNCCDKNIGKLFVVTGAPIRQPYVEEGRFAFDVRQTLLWNGVQVVYPETNKPADDIKIPAKRKLEF